MSHGLVVAMGDRAEYWLLNTKSDTDETVKLEKVGSSRAAGGRQKRQKNGGQSAARFSRLRENQIAAIVKQMADECTKHFIDQDGLPTIKTLALGGSGGAQVGLWSQLSRSPHLVKCLRAILLSGFALDDPTINHLVMASAAERLKAGAGDNGEITKLTREFEAEISIGGGKAVYGVEELNAAAKQGQLQVLVAIEGDPIIDTTRAGNAKTRIITLSKTNIPSVIRLYGPIALSYFHLNL